MSKLGFFIGGTLLGAAGLAAAALAHDKISGTEPAPKADRIRAMDAAEISRQLRIYFFKATSLSLKCTGLFSESAFSDFPSINFPDDGFFTKMGNKIEGGMNRICRGMTKSQVLDLKNEAKKLYRQHRNLFIQANNILYQKGVAGISLADLTLDDQHFVLNNAMDNENWLDDLHVLCEAISAFLTKTADVADQLSSRLDSLDDVEDNLPAVCNNASAHAEA